MKLLQYFIYIALAITAINFLGFIWYDQTFMDQFPEFGWWMSVIFAGILTIVCLAWMIGALWVNVIQKKKYEERRRKKIEEARKEWMK